MPAHTSVPQTHTITVSMKHLPTVVQLQNHSNLNESQTSNNSHVLTIDALIDFDRRRSDTYHRSIFVLNMRGFLYTSAGTARHVSA